MEGYDATSYGEAIAGTYDDYVGGKFDEEAEVALLAELAGEGRVLELGVGTGRVAIPWPGSASRCTASNPPPPWWTSSGPSPTARRSP